ncbi:MAG TPA: thioredoxin-disulfide reductase [Thermoplasmatales archaeon]|nr:thioredoxin-disulfide reductase [Thermoplasmatales archaeon]
MNYELAVIGAGPAGFSAGIYAGRAGINTVVFDKGNGGGLAAISPRIENYPGFESISGIELVEKMKRHAEKYCTLRFYEEVTSIKKIGEKCNVETTEDTYEVGAIILAMGTEHRKLDVPGEKEYQGRGVSYCATCDGFFFKDKKVAVVGGGNTALVEAIYLKQVGCREVYVIHRRDQLRAEKTYQQEAIDKGINFLLKKTVREIKGDELVKNLILIDVETKEETILPIDGVFISIGVIPQNKLAEQLQVKLTEQGYIVVDSEMRTNIRGVYAAGDITGGLRQIVTAVAEGATAALTSTEALGKSYPY